MCVGISLLQLTLETVPGGRSRLLNWTSTEGSLRYYIPCLPAETTSERTSCVQQIQYHEYSTGRIYVDTSLQQLVIVLCTPVGGATGKGSERSAFGLKNVRGNGPSPGGTV